MKRFAGIVLVSFLVCACEQAPNTLKREGIASPNMKIPLSLVQLEMACEDIASIIMVSMSNRLRNVDIYKSRGFARSVADAFEQRFHDLAPDIRLQTRGIYMQTVNDQYLADDNVIQNQVLTFRKYGETKFREGAITMCKHGLANVPQNEALPVMQLRN